LHGLVGLESTTLSRLWLVVRRGVRLSHPAHLLLVVALLSENREFAEVSFTILGLFLAADDEPSRALVQKGLEATLFRHMRRRDDD
jgi:hypothetical protein